MLAVFRKASEVRSTQGETRNIAEDFTHFVLPVLTSDKMPDFLNELQ
jgi:hypothetical protein